MKKGSKQRVYSYAEAAMVLGCDHHWIRMKTNRGDFDIVERVEVRPNVLKVFISADQVDAYRETRRFRRVHRVTLTEDERAKFIQVFGKERLKS